MCSILMVRTKHGLQPHSACDAEALDSVKIGSLVAVDIKQRRSVPKHRWFFASIAEIVKSGAVPFVSSDEFLDALKLGCGVVEFRKNLDGAMYAVPGSISFLARDEIKFTEFVETVRATLLQRYGVDLGEARKTAGV